MKSTERRVQVGREQRRAVYFNICYAHLIGSGKRNDGMQIAKKIGALGIQLFLVAGCSGAGEAQTTEDTCASAQVDATRAAEYRLKKAQFQGASAEYRTAILALSEAKLALTNRVPKELFEARFSAETSMIKSLSSDAAKEVLTQIGSACVDRLLKSPQAEIAALNEQSKAIRALLESPQFEERYRQETARIQRDYATEASAAQALKGRLEALRREISANAK